MKSQAQLHLCDFDGTLTRGDSFVRFLLFTVPLPRLIGGGILLVCSFLGLILTGRWTNERGKAAVLAQYFGEQHAEALQALGNNFCRQKLPGLLRTDLLARLRQALREGHTVAIVSASPDLWLRPFCEAEQFECICTALAYEADHFNGHFATPNCNGAEKARRIQSAYQLKDFGKIIAYGNSKGDAAMYALADEVFKF